MARYRKRLDQPGQGLKEGPTLFRTYELLMYGGLLSTSLWLGTPVHAQDVKASDPFAASSTPTFQAASDSEVALTPEEVNKIKVQTLMRESRLRMQEGKREEALLLAARATSMAQHLKVSFSPNELTPQKLLGDIRKSAVTPVAGVQTSEKAVPAIGNAAAQASEEMLARRAEVQNLLHAAYEDLASQRYEAARSKAIEAQKYDVAYGVFDLRPENIMKELVQMQPANAAGPSETLASLTSAPQQLGNRQVDLSLKADNLDPKTRATQMLADAKLAMSKGHYNEARQLIVQAHQQGAKWSLLEESPDILMLELENVSKQKVFVAGNTAPAADAQDVRQQAIQLVKQSRAALTAGDLAVAHAKAVEAQSLNATFELFEDSPELLLQEVKAKQGPARLASAGSPATPVAAPAGDMKAQASELLRQARAAMQSGDVATAQKIVEQAEAIDVAFGLFEDNPETVKKDLDRMVAARGNKTAQSAVSGQTDSRESLKAQAAELLTAAKADLEAGQFEAAKTKAAQAATFNVSYGLFEYSPERLLADIEAASRKTSPIAQAKGNVFSDAAYASGNGQVFTANAEVKSSVTVQTEGMTAQQMFDEGVSQLQEGEQAVAYEYFMQAYHSGEKLDDYRQQQLQAKLRELRPRRHTDNVQTVSHESFSGLSLDPVASPKTNEFEKLRTECLNAIFRADSIRESKPEEAIQLLTDTLNKIDAAGLTSEQTASLTNWVKNSRDSIEQYVALHSPVIELERRNSETKDTIEREIQTRVRVEQEIATLVQKYNDLYNQNRFSEASAVAKQAAALDQSNPVVVTMETKAAFALANHNNQRLKAAKAESFNAQLNAVEWAAVNNVPHDDMPMAYADNFLELTAKRPKQHADVSLHTEAELRVRRSLSQPVSLHFDNAPLQEVISHIGDTQGININLDSAGLSEQVVSTSTPVTIHADGIMLSNALALILNPLELGYIVRNEVLMITSKDRRHGDLEPRVYPVADLVVPLESMSNKSRASSGTGFGNDGRSMLPVGLQSVGANGLSQVNAQGLNGMSGQRSGLNGPAGIEKGFEALSRMISTTIRPDSWAEMNGPGEIVAHDGTLSLVIRQTQQVHEEIANLLDQMRRLQEIQITIEVRFITVSESFFEQIGIDFDFNINDTVGSPKSNNDFSPMRRFGSTDPIYGGGIGSTTGNTGNGDTGATSGNGFAPYQNNPNLNMQDRDNWGSRTVVGLLNGTDQFTPTLDVPFRQGSFDLAQPTFGGFDANAGINFGMAILSDLEAFMFVRAAQADRRSNVMFAPKVTMFNGQTGMVSNSTIRPYVQSLEAASGTFQVGYVPVIDYVEEGTTMSVTAVASADRRYVRLSVFPNFRNVTDIFSYSYISGGGNTGGGGVGGGIGGGGVGGGIGGGGTGGGIGGGIGGGTGGTGGGTGTVSIQQPIVDTVFVSTVVSVPDGGTVLLGGVKSLREGRNMAGVPILNKIPYISRLFKNSGVGRETESLMMMVTPRIIIQEEQEQMLGVAQ